MDFLGYLITGDLQASTPGPTDDFWYRSVGGSGFAASGQRVDPDSAQKVSAFYAGVRLLANDVAKLPLELYQRLEDGGKDRTRKHPLYDLLHTQPNAWQTSFEWRRQGMRHLILRGNWYNRILPGRRGAVDQLVPIHPDLVTPEQLDSGRVVYKIRHPKTGITTTTTQDDIFHVRGVSDDGVEGKSVLAWARDSIGIALATESYAGRLFSQGALHGPRITVPGSLTTEQRTAMADSYMTSQQDWHRPFVLLNGATVADPELTPEDSQFLLSRQFSVTEMARWLGIQPHKIADLTRSTNNNIEHQGLEYVTDSLSPWLVLIEQAILRDLILVPDRYFAEFNIDGLLRGDSAARGALYEKLFNIGAVSPNDVLRRENMNTYEGGDQRFVPQNMRPLDEPYREPAPKVAQPAGQGRAIAISAAARLLRKELTAIEKQAPKFAKDRDGWAVWVAEFYSTHVALVMDSLQIGESDAKAYCASQATQVVESIAAMQAWRAPDYAAQIADWALGLEAA